MDAVVLLTRALEAGLTVTTDGEHLTVRGPKRLEPLAKQLLAHKPELLVLLRQSSGSGSVATAATELATPETSPTVETFITAHLTLDPAGHVLGADLYAAFATWRQVGGAADGTCTWSELVALLEQRGAHCDTREDPTVWRGG